MMLHILLPIALFAGLLCSQCRLAKYHCYFLLSILSLDRANCLRKQLFHM